MPIWNYSIHFRLEAKLGNDKSGLFFCEIKKLIWHLKGFNFGDNFLF